MATNGIIGPLRWLAVLPGAALAAIVSTVPLHLVLYQTLTGSGLIEPYPELPERLLGPVAASVAFVWAGARIAPSHKVMAAATLLGLLVLIGGTVLALGLSGAPIGGQHIQLEHGGLALAGAIIGAVIGFGIVRFEQRDSEK